LQLAEMNGMQFNPEKAINIKQETKKNYSFQSPTMVSKNKT